HLRFRLPERIEHWVLVASFFTLALSGLVQKYASVGIARSFIAFLGGIENARRLHHLAAIVMMFEAIYHIGAVAYKIFIRRTRITMLPGLNDIRTAWQALLYNLGLSKTKPQQGRYTFDEKIEYWAVIWGTLVMGITGFMMWNPIAATRVLPGTIVPAAKAAHGGEALLAVLAIIVWHLYHVHIRHLNLSMFTGHLSEEEMLEDHPLELADLKAGIGEQPVDSQILKRRRRIFFPIYAVAAVIMLFGVYFFIAYEETAITTLPPAEEVVVFVPLTPTPFPTALPTKTSDPERATSWQDGFADLFGEKCGMCHSSSSALGGLDLSDYQTALEGGDSGPAIVPGDPDASLLLARQDSGDHPGQLDGDELALVRQWIEAGAPEE
ncbi:MAG: cytochrome b/b6 domain-containing protein, partial [Candidatus Hodarchaeota archaeon]